MASASDIYRLFTNLTTFPFLMISIHIMEAAWATYIAFHRGIFKVWIPTIVLNKLSLPKPAPHKRDQTFRAFIRFVKRVPRTDLVVPTIGSQSPAGGNVAYGVRLVRPGSADALLDSMRWRSDHSETVSSGSGVSPSHQARSSSAAPS